MAWPCCCFVQDLTLYFYKYIYIYICILWFCQVSTRLQLAKKGRNVPFFDEENEIPEHMMIEGFRWSISHLGLKVDPTEVWIDFLTYGCFQKQWFFTPQIINFNRVFHYKPSILGYPYFGNNHIFRSNIQKLSKYTTWIFKKSESFCYPKICMNKCRSLKHFGYV